LLIMTSTEQFPAAADAESTMTTLPVDTMLQDEAAAEQTVAVQVWDPKMKLLPDSVTVPPAYAAAGIADAMLGPATTLRIVDALTALLEVGFEKFTLTTQLPGLSDAAATSDSTATPRIEQLGAATPQMAAEQFWAPGMKLPPDTVRTLPA
jgi:hypothetical protein